VTARAFIISQNSDTKTHIYKRQCL